MHQQSSRQLQERLTSLSVAEVLDAAEYFFAFRSGIYTAFIEKRSATHLAMRGQGNEEIVVGTRVTGEGTMVSASTYFFDQQVARFLSSLPVPLPRAAAQDKEPLVAREDPAAAAAGDSSSGPGAQS